MKRIFPVRSMLYTSQSRQIPTQPEEKSKDPDFCPLPSQQDRIDKLKHEYRTLKIRLEHVKSELYKLGFVVPP